MYQSYRASACRRVKMAVFAVELEKSPIVDEFIKETDERLSNKPKTPFFDGRAVQFDICMYIVWTKCIYPPMHILGGIFWIFGYVFIQRFSWAWFIPGAILMLPLAFKHWLVYYVMFYIGLRRKGYSGYIHIL